MPLFCLERLLNVPVVRDKTIKMKIKLIFTSRLFNSEMFEKTTHFRASLDGPTPSISISNC